MEPESPESSARPLLILLHGTRMNAGQWASYAEALADVAEVITPDLPGHGLRDGEPFSLDRVVADIEALVDAAGDRPVMLGGHSLGGYAALCYAERHPVRLSGLVLMGCAAEAVGVVGRIGAAIYLVAGQCWGGMSDRGLAWLDRHHFARVIDARIWPAIKARGGQFRAVRAAWAEVLARCGAKQLRHVKCPVLILGGSHDQLHLHARRFAAAAPQGTIRTGRGRGHLWPMTHPDEVATELRAWIAEIMQG